MKINITNPRKQIILKSIILILFGVALFIFPQYSINSILLILWLFLIVVGLFSIFTSIKRKTNKTINKLMIRQWVFDILVGWIISLYPQQTAELLVGFIGLRILLMGIVQLVQNFSYPEQRKSKIFYALIRLIIGVVIITDPRNSTLTLTYMIGISSILLWIALIILSIKIKKLFEKSHQSLHVDIIDWEEIK